MTSRHTSEPRPRLRIALLAPSRDLQGPIGEIVDTLAEELARLSCEVAIFSWGRRTDRQSTLPRAADRLSDIWRTSRALKARHYDILVVNTAHDWATLTRDLLLFAFTRRRPATALYFHGSLPPRASGGVLFRLASRRLLRQVSAAFVLSSEELNGWAPLAGNVPVRLVANPYRPKARRESEAGRDDGEFRLLFVGRLIREKGAEMLIRAAGMSVANPQLRVVIAGDGPRTAAVRRLVEKVPVKVEVLGFLSPDQLANEYERADAFALPTSWCEGFPTVLAEALGYGLPIITTKIRGAADHLEDERNALLIPPGDLQALTAAIDRLTSDVELRKRMRNENVKLVERFAPGRVASEFLDLLEATSRGELRGGGSVVSPCTWIADRYSAPLDE